MMKLKIKEKVNLQKCQIREIEILLILFKVYIFFLPQDSLKNTYENQDSFSYKKILYGPHPSVRKRDLFLKFYL